MHRFRFAVVFALCAAASMSGAGQDGPRPAAAADHGGIDPAVVTAWERAGASFQWIDEYPAFAFRPGEAPAPADLSRLPPPGVPFALRFERVLTPGHQHALQALAHLRVLAHGRSDPANLEWMSELKQLETLRLDFLEAQPSAEELGRLAGLPALRTLGLRDLTVTAATLDSLASLRNLRSLDLMFSTITDEHLLRLTVLTELQHLVLHDTAVTGRTIGALRALPNLKRLELGGNAITDALLTELPKLGQLESLTLWNGTRLSADEPAALAQLSRLRRLALYYPTSWSDEWVPQLSRLQALEALELYFSDPKRSLTDVGLAQFSRFPNLESLRLYGARISDAGLGSLVGVKGLRSLFLHQTPITDDGIRTLASHLSLQELGLNHIVTDRGLESLEGMRSLERLRIPDLPPRKAVSSAGLRRLISANAALRINGLSAERYLESLRVDEALQTANPETRLAALEAIRAGVSSAQARRVDEALLSTLATQRIDHADRIGAVIDRAIAAIPSGSTPTARMAATLPAVEPFADQPAQAARIGTALKRALAGLAEEPPLRGLELPKLRAQGLAVLARSQLAAGQAAEAQDSIERSLALTPLSTNRNSGTLLATLAQIKARRGDATGAVDAYLSAAVAAPLTEPQKAELSALFRSARGSDAGLEAELAARYRALFPNPAKPVRYTPAPARSSRVALLELFSGSGCLPCRAADLGMEALLHRYAPDEVAVVVYHLSIPQPDPIGIEASGRRADYYGVQGNPQAFVDGRHLEEDISGVPAESQAAHERFASALDARLVETPSADLSIRAMGEGDRITVDATVKRLPVGHADLRLHILLVERDVGYLGENGIRQHLMSVRAAAGTGGSGLPVTGTGTTTQVFSLEAVKADVARTLADEIARRRRNGRLNTFTAEGHAATRIDPSQLVVVAFIQQGAYAPGRANVLQAAQTDVVFNESKK